MCSNNNQPKGLRIKRISNRIISAVLSFSLILSNGNIIIAQANTAPPKSGYAVKDDKNKKTSITALSIIGGAGIVIGSGAAIIYGIANHFSAKEQREKAIAEFNNALTKLESKDDFEFLLTAIEKYKNGASLPKFKLDINNLRHKLEINTSDFSDIRSGIITLTENRIKYFGNCDETEYLRAQIENRFKENETQRIRIEEEKKRNQEECETALNNLKSELSKIIDPEDFEFLVDIIRKNNKFDYKIKNPITEICLQVIRHKKCYDFPYIRENREKIFELLKNHIKCLDSFDEAKDLTETIKGYVRKKEEQKKKERAEKLEKLEKEKKEREQREKEIEKRNEERKRQEEEKQKRLEEERKLRKAEGDKAKKEQAEKRKQDKIDEETRIAQLNEERKKYFEEHKSKLENEFTTFLNRAASIFEANESDDEKYKKRYEKNKEKYSKKVTEYAQNETVKKLFHEIQWLQHHDENISIPCGFFALFFYKYALVDDFDIVGINTYALSPILMDYWVYNKTFVINFLHYIFELKSEQLSHERLAYINDRLEKLKKENANDDTAVSLIECLQKLKIEPYMNERKQSPQTSTDTDDSAFFVPQDFGNYKGLGHLGAGASAHVWLYQENESGKKVAVKTLTSGGNFTRCFIPKSPYIAQIFGYEDDGKKMVMEYVEGGMSFMKALFTRKYDKRKILDICTQFAKAFGALQNDGCTHSDLYMHSNNVLIDKNDTVKIIDVDSIGPTSDSEKNMRDALTHILTTLITTDRSLYDKLIEKLPPLKTSWGVFSNEQQYNMVYVREVIGPEYTFDELIKVLEEMKAEIPEDR